MSDVYMVEDNLLPVLHATLSDENGVINIGSGTVVFRMEDENTGEVKVNASASITSASGGTVYYTWVTGDTDTPGVYRMKWELTIDGKLLTVPNTNKVDRLIVLPR